MPNYSLVVTPQYNPMSYEQYIAPFREYAGVYNQMADIEAVSNTLLNFRK